MRRILIVLATLVAGVTAFSRLDVGNGVTCGGAKLTEQIKANIRGENPDVPVTLIARYPMLNKTAFLLSNIHVYSAIILLAIVYAQLLLKKGGKLHVLIGRVLSWGIVPHYLPIAYALNVLAILTPVADWLLAPPMSDWRAQVSYIVPFGINTTVDVFLAFFYNRFPWASSPLLNKAAQAVTVFSFLWWCTIGLYISGDQILGGLGNFGIWEVPGYGKTQGFFSTLNIILLAVGSTQAYLDYINYKLLVVISRDGGVGKGKTFTWKDQHKWGCFVFCYQSIIIFATFLAYVPFCVWEGMPEWTCISEPFYAAPVIVVMFLPLKPMAMWAVPFASTILTEAAKPQKKA